MTEIDNDKLLKDFFAENKREIADNGFSRRVMHHLPDRSNRLARLWTVFVMAVGATPGSHLPEPRGDFPARSSSPWADWKPYGKH